VYDKHRAVSVFGARGAHRPQQKTGESTVTPAADDQHLRAFAGLKEQRSGRPMSADGEQVSGPMLAEGLIERALQRRS